MKRPLIVIALLLAGCGVGRLSIVNEVGAQDPCGSHFRTGTYFEDLQVIRTVDHHEFTVSELMEMIDKQPNVRTVSLQVDPPRQFSIDSLLYPQDADRYMLTQAEWADLQAAAKRKLRDPIAAPEVIAHWKSIANGTPPFGIRVRSN